MVNALTFDTHQFVKDLTAVGFSDAQAETVTRLLGRSREIDIAELATKSDLGLIKSDLERMATKTELAETKADLLKWMVGSIAFQTLAVLGGVAALLRLVG